MRIELDGRPQTNDQKVSFCIRLYPETNKDITDMKWGLEVVGKVREVIEAGLTSQFHWVICFEDRR